MTSYWTLLLKELWCFCSWPTATRSCWKRPWTRSLYLPLWWSECWRLSIRSGEVGKIQSSNKLWFVAVFRSTRVLLLSEVSPKPSQLTQKTHFEPGLNSFSHSLTFILTHTSICCLKSLITIGLPTLNVYAHILIYRATKIMKKGPGFTWLPRAIKRLPLSA